MTRDFTQELINEFGPDDSSIPPVNNRVMWFNGEGGLTAGPYQDPYTEKQPDGPGVNGWYREGYKFSQECFDIGKYEGSGAALAHARQNCARLW